MMRGAVILIALISCSRDAPRTRKLDPEAPVRVVLATPAGEASVSVEVADSPEDIERGLMFRKELPAESGMLFLMKREKDWSFWMQNTLIPLDIIFITKQLTVAGIIHRATPGSKERRSVGVPSIYVLEVNGGWAEQHGIATAGTKVVFDNLRL